MNRPIIRIVATDGKAYPLAQAAAPIVPANNGAAATLPRHLDEAFAAILADDGKAFDEAMARFEADLAGVGK